MPALIRQVDFAPAPVYSRQPRDDEKFVMRQFSSHAKRCGNCYNPYQTHLSGGSLCSRGHDYALDVFQYVYNKAGQPISLVDREEQGQRVIVEIPSGCESVRDLLKAIDRGMRLSQRVSSISYDANYPVQERPLIVDSRHSNQPTYAIVERARSPRRHVQVYHASQPLSSGARHRGSLYREDTTSRRTRYHDDPVYVHAAPRLRVPRDYEVRR